MITVRCTLHAGGVGHRITVKEVHRSSSFSWCEGDHAPVITGQRQGEKAEIADNPPNQADS